MIDAVTGRELFDFVYNDGGRGNAGFKGAADDCVVRAISIATELPYLRVYNDLHESMKAKLASTRPGTKLYAMRAKNTSPRGGVNRSSFQPYLESLGWVWFPTMGIGQGTTVHLLPDELPRARIIVRVSKHMTATEDGILYDTYDPSRVGTRAVYGFFRKAL